MKSTLLRLGLVALMIGTLAGCGGGGSDEVAVTPPPVTPPPVTPPVVNVASAVSSAAAVAANDTASNSSAPFTVLQNAGLPAVTVNSPPKVNFTVFSDGAVKQGLTTSNVSFIIAKLVPGTNGNPDQWVSYTYRTETAAAGVGPNGAPKLATAKQATTDTKTATQLVYNADGYYTYTFSTDIKDPTKTNGVVFEPGLTHRVAIQLSYTNKAGATVLANPYFDFTVDASGNAVAVTDSSKTRKMTDVNSCNTCHAKLALHGGGRVDTQYCVMCHNSGTTDANSGYVLDLRTMAHKIHAGRRLHSKGEDYVIWGYNNTKLDFSEVGFPQDLRNCTKCHSAANASTPQGDNWKSKPSKEACLTCHKSETGTSWDTTHITTLKLGANAAAVTNGSCAGCHGVNTQWSAEQVHWNQNEENAVKYKMNIESATYDSATRKVTVKYYLSDPTNANKAYDLKEGCTGNCTTSNKFGNLRFYVAYQTLKNQPTTTTEYSSYNNGGSSANAYAYTGTNDGTNHYTVAITIPADTATSEAKGTARVISIGQIKEPTLDVVSRLPVAPATLLNVSVQNTTKELALSGTLTPRRTVVSNDKCNACHSLLGTTSGSNMLTNAFHSGARDTVEACVLCHDPLRMSSTVMADGSSWNESYQFKRMIHGIHGGTKRAYPFTHGNTKVGAFSKEGKLLSDGVTPFSGATPTSEIINYTAEVAYPGHLWDCNTCHVNNAYQKDLSQIGAVINKPIDPATGVATTDPLLWKVISPKAAACTACHDSGGVQTHVVSVGGATFGGMSQGDYLGGKVLETCDGCHVAGGLAGVDTKHGIK